MSLVIDNNTVILGELLRALNAFVYKGTYNGVDCIIKLIESDDPTPEPNELHIMKVLDGKVAIPKLIAGFNSNISLMLDEEEYHFNHIIVIEYLPNARDLKDLSEIPLSDKL